MCETRRLRHLNIFKQIPMEECILNIKLMKNPASRYSKREKTIRTVVGLIAGLNVSPKSIPNNGEKAWGDAGSICELGKLLEVGWAKACGLRCIASWAEVGSEQICKEGGPTENCNANHVSIEGCT